MDINHIKKITDSLSKLIEDSEKIALPVFAAKLSQASEIHPEDKTIGAMADVVSRMANGKKFFITRAEIKDLYNRLFTRNTKFSQLFETELGNVEKPAGPKLYDRPADDGNDIISRDYDKVVDPLLANALNSAFGNKTKGYSDVAAKAAKAVCERSCGVVKVASSVEVINGNSDFIVCKAAFETPKGQTFVFVPIEIVANKTLTPSVFIGNDGPEDFSKSNLESYVVKNAGLKLTLNDSVVFDAIKSLKQGDVGSISNVDLAVIKLNAAKDTQVDYMGNNSVLFQKVASEEKNLVVETPRYKDEEIESFAKAFNSSTGVAKFNFGRDKINLGRTVISNKLTNFGLNKHQISVFDSDEKSVTYAVSLNGGTVAFRVPVKISNNNLCEPDIIISNGSIESFSKQGLETIITNKNTDYKAAAVASPLYDLKSSELVQTVRDAVEEENHTKAEDALNILSQSGDEKAYQSAFTIYSNGLSSKKATECKCSRIVKNAHSSHSLCGHTGLPLHKVYQDKNGDCHPLYRRGMEDTREGAYFMNSKIFF